MHQFQENRQATCESTHKKSRKNRRKGLHNIFETIVQKRSRMAKCATKRSNENSKNEEHEVHEDARLRHCTMK